MSKNKDSPPEDEYEDPRLGEYFLEDVHDYSVNRYDFVIWLAGENKIYGAEDEDFGEPGVEYQMSTKFIKNLDILSSIDHNEPILVHMKTCGGYWEEGMAIYDAIQACANPITILSYTHARSMSSIILQAADKRVLMPNSYFLFHRGRLELSGIESEVLSNFDWVNDVCAPTMMDIYVKRLKEGRKFRQWSLKRIEKMLKEKMDEKVDVFLTAKEAVRWGFADSVFNFDWTKLLATKKRDC